MRSTTAPSRLACWSTKNRARAGMSSDLSASAGTRSCRGASGARSAGWNPPSGERGGRGAGHDAHVGGCGLASLPLPARRLEDDGQALLERGRHPVDLLEKEGASLREVELAEMQSTRLRRARVREEARGLAGGEEGAVDVDERLARAGRSMVDRAGHGFLSRAVRPREDQDVEGRRMTRDRLAQRARGRALPDEGAVHAPPGLGQELLCHRSSRWRSAFRHASCRCRRCTVKWV